MKIFPIVFCLLSFPLFLPAQKRGYLSMAPGLHLTDNRGSGLHVSGNRKVGDLLYLGLGGAVLGFRDIKPVYIPITGEATVYFKKDRTRHTGFLHLSGGYSAHYRRQPLGRGSYTTTGGPVFAGDLGLRAGSKRSNLFISLGYSSFGFRSNLPQTDLDGNVISNRTNYNLNGVSIKAGIQL